MRTVSCYHILSSQLYTRLANYPGIDYTRTDMSKKILIVDDDAFIREANQALLQSEGYDVAVAADGKEGLDMIMAKPYDLILLDVMLPQIDGLGILMKLKEKKPAHPLGPILLFTNLSNDPAVKQGLKLGAQGILNKADVKPEDMLEQIKKIVTAP